MAESQHLSPTHIRISYGQTFPLQDRMAITREFGLIPAKYQTQSIALELVHE
jgi:hypothetical protein